MRLFGFVLGDGLGYVEETKVISSDRSSYENTGLFILAGLAKMVDHSQNEGGFCTSSRRFCGRWKYVAPEDIGKYPFLKGRIVPTRLQGYGRAQLPNGIGEYATVNLNGLLGFQLPGDQNDPTLAVCFKQENGRRRSSFI